MPTIAPAALGIALVVLAAVLGVRPIVLIRVAALVAVGHYAYAHAGDLNGLVQDAASQLSAHVKEALR